MQPPQVRTLDQLMAYTNPVYDPQKQQINQQIEQAGTAGTAAEQGLRAEADQQYKNISQRASNLGMLFSGFAPDQQAQYNATKFMPALANLRSTVQNNIARLQGSLLSLDSDQRKHAMDLQQGDQGMLNNFNIAQQQAALKQQELQQQMEIARMNNNSRIQAASIRSAASANKPLTQQQVVAAIRNGLMTVTGKDNHAAPQDLARAYNDFLGAGFKAEDFWKNFQGFWNPNQTNYGDQFYGAVSGR